MSLRLKIICIVLLVIHIKLSSTLPSFRIIAPQTICDQPKNSSLTNDPQGIVVGFQPRDGVKLSYKVRVFFKTTANRSRSQRSILLVWKAVRSLENRINIKERLKISQQNMLSINKTEVEPGAVYIFHIIGITDAGEVSNEQIFTIKYISGVLERNETAAGTSLILIGAENTVASVPYTLSARVSFCIPRYDYLMRWKMFGLDEEFQDILHTTGTVLKMPPNSLIAGKEYQIQAFVLQSNNSIVLAQDSITVQVIKRGFQAYIIPTSVKIGYNSPAIFEIFIQDFDNNCDPLDILWVCTANDGESCAPIENANSTKREFFFTVSGSYRIIATVKLGNIKSSTTAEVIVDPTIYLSYEFSNIPNLVPAAGQSLQFSVLIVDLIPNCKAGWSTAQEEGYMYIPAEEIGDGFGTVEVNDIEKQYLSEIADFGNSTVNKEVILHIPVASGKWNGLLGDTIYKFRLDTVCPGPYISNDPESIHREVVSSFEFVVYANSPPVGGNLTIKPQNGTAMRTIFEITTESAKDLLLDRPLSYEFIIQVEQFNISLGKFYEFKALETILPYSKNPILLKSSVCDIRRACSQNLGPQIRVKMAEYSPEEIALIEDRIKKAFLRSDLNEGQNLILMAVLTFKNIPNNEKTFINFKTFTFNLLLKQIETQLEKATEKYYISKEDIVNFVSQTKTNLEILNINDQTTLRKLLDLLDLSGEETNEYVYESNIESFRRRKRGTNADAVLLPLEGRSIIDESYVRMNLNLIEKILQSYKDENMQQEKAKIVQKIPLLAMKMCTSDLITKENIYTSVAVIDLEKMTGNHLLEKNFTIRNDFAPDIGNFQITLPSLKSRIKTYCAAFIQFPEDYFDGNKQVTYKLQIMDLATMSSINEVGTKSDSFVVEFKMSKFGNDYDACLMRSEELWSPKFCSTKSVTTTYIACSCRNFGFLKTGYQQKYMTTHSDDVEMFASIDKRPPNRNFVSSTTMRPTIEVNNTTRSKAPSSRPITIPAKPTQAALTRNITNLPNADTKDGNLKQSEETTSTASTLGYILPFIGLLSILGIMGGVVFYKRRKRNIFRNNMQGLDVALPRESRAGVKYAKFYDEHLMSGTFSNTTVP